MCLQSSLKLRFTGTFCEEENETSRLHSFNCFGAVEFCLPFCHHSDWGSNECTHWKDIDVSCGKILMFVLFLLTGCAITVELLFNCLLTCMQEFRLGTFGL